MITIPGWRGVSRIIDGIEERGKLDRRRTAGALRRDGRRTTTADHVHAVCQARLRAPECAIDRRQLMGVPG